MALSCQYTIFRAYPLWRSAMRCLLRSMIQFTLTAIFLLAMMGWRPVMGGEVGDHIKLPPHLSKGAMTVEEALDKRRSRRVYSDAPLMLEDVAQILWAAQGITHKRGGLRTAPSAGALYPLELYLISGDVEGLAAGLYHYQPVGHKLIRLKDGDLRDKLTWAVLFQNWIQNAPAIVVISAVYQRSEEKYEEMAERYVHIEVGHVSQNIYLQATSRKLATVFVGAFGDLKIQKILGLPADHIPVGLMPLGQSE